MEAAVAADGHQVGAFEGAGLPAHAGQAVDVTVAGRDSAQRPGQRADHPRGGTPSPPKTLYPGYA
jgi:hypothetical protein